jgi:beta-galactosidase/beta-glucuronidase
MRHFLLLYFFLLLFPSSAQKLKLSDHWAIKSTLEVKEPDKKVASVGYSVADWYSTSLPATVLNVFVKNGTYPDPRLAMNNFRIPDVSDKFNNRFGLSTYSYLNDKRNPWKYPYWFRTETVFPKQYKGKHVWLIFNGINYRADIWVNGHLVADSSQVSGMFRRFRFDIAPYALPGEKNCIAVKIYQVDHPGDPEPGTQFEVFGTTRGHATDIFKDETLKMSGGWDCAPVVRDRNMGIYQDVFVKATGDVTLEHPYVTTTLPLPDTSRADIRITAELSNLSGHAVKGRLIANIQLLNELEFPSYTKQLGGLMRSVEVGKEIVLQPGEKREVELSPDEFEKLTIHNPCLWYPNGYGKQYLHRLRLSFRTAGGESDVKEVTFGIRQVTTELKRIGDEAGRIFRVNGKRIFCKGGWLQPDMLLDMSRKRIFDEARLLAEAGMNVVGSEDMPAPTDDMMEACDKYGLMYWEIFFQCWRMYPGSDWAHYPLDHALAKAEVRDMVLRYRNHPSVTAWFLANEVIVDEDLYRAAKGTVKQLDPARPFIPTTSIDWNVEKLTPYMQEDLPTGMTDDGAPDYNWNPPAYYFDKVNEVHLQMFRNELGVPSMPVYSSLKKFIPTVTIPRSQTRNPIYPLDSLWAEHGAWDGNNYCFRSYDNAIRTLYGNPATAEEYADRAQLVNADSYRAMFEAANHRMWNITSGVMLWKLNSCWPDVGWQIYDWFLQPNAAYYFSKKATEPLHIQMNADSRMVSVINAMHHDRNRLTVEASVIDFNMKTVWNRTDTVSVAADSYREMTSVPKQTSGTPVYFVKLTLKDAAGNLLSDNLYWQCSQHEDFSALTLLPKPQLKQQITMLEQDKETHWTIRLKNETGQLSFFNRLSLMDDKSKEEILPSFWSDNYITLFPGEEKTITVVVAKEELKGKEPEIEIR